MKCIIFSLSRSLIMHMLEVWLSDLRDLAAMDMAFTAKTFRGYFLSLMRIFSLKWIEAPSSSIFRRSCADFMKWLALRRIPMATLPVNVRYLDAIAEVTHCSDFADTRCVNFIATSKGPAPSATALSQFFMGTKTPLAIDCSRWTDVSDEMLRALDGVALTALSLPMCFNVSAEALASLLGRCGHLLHTLHIPSTTLTTKAVDQISRHGRTLTSLEVLACRLPSSALMRLLMSCPHLVRLELRDLEGSTVNDEMIHCLRPALQSLSLTNCSAVTFRALNFILQSCPRLTALSVPDKAIFRWNKDGSGVVQYTGRSEEGLLALLGHARCCPIDSITIVIHCILLDDALCAFLIAHFRLKALSLGLRADSPTALVRRLVDACPRLRTISFCVPSDMAVSCVGGLNLAAAMGSLPLSLVVLDHPAITDAALARLLHGCPRLGFVHLGGCPLVSDAALRFIAHQGCSCDQLVVANTGITPLGAVEFVQEMGSLLGAVVVPRAWEEAVDVVVKSHGALTIWRKIKFV